jgi:hypothetical protein
MEINELTDGKLRNYVDGEWAPVDGAAGTDVVNPATVRPWHMCRSPSLSTSTVSWKQ